MTQLDRTARQSARWMTLLAGPPLALFLLFPGFMMGLFGDEFRAGAPLLAVLAVGQFINVATGSVGYLLIMSGHEKWILNRSIFIAAISLALNLLLIPRFGTLGAAMATAISVASTNLIALYLVHKHLGITILPLGSKS